MNSLSRWIAWIGSWLALIIPVSLLAAQAGGTNMTDNIGHLRHRHHYGPHLATEPPSPSRFITSRSSAVTLPLPKEEDAFTFAVFGDRTGGPVAGVSVLADAVRDVNLIEPDLVMTVGDLVNGYNAREAWLEQAKEFKGIMSELRSPWFPVAGNHDVYWRGPNRPVDEHDGDYEMHFGPLWYAFTHKKCWFVVLYSDETHPVNGDKDYTKPQNHEMSEAQFTWLKEILAKARGAEHVFLFLHHPRWNGGPNYGSSWDRVHKELVAAGNVTAVFAGHIHRMRYDPKDGIEYVTLATVGGAQDATVPSVGWAHEFHLVTVRKGRLALSAVPVGQVMDVREITGEFANECAKQARAGVAFDAPLAFGRDGAMDRPVRVGYTNLTSRPIDITVEAGSDDARWMFAPDHVHARLEPGQVWSAAFGVRRGAGLPDEAWRLPMLTLNAEVIAGGHRYPLEERVLELPLDRTTVPEPRPGRGEQALALDGSSALALDSGSVPLPQGAFTLETWFRADEFGERTGLACKTEVSDYGIFVSKGVPSFLVHLDGDYVTVTAPQAVPAGRWTHVAGVFDGAEVRLYVDGALAARKPGKGTRKTNTLPLVIGADPSPNGGIESYFKGQVDGTRLASKAVYAGDRFRPQRRPAGIPGATVFLSNYDLMAGRSVWDNNARRPVGTVSGGAKVAAAR